MSENNDFFDLGPWVSLAKQHKREQVSETIIRMKSARGLDLLANLATSGAISTSLELDNLILDEFNNDKELDYYWFPEYCRTNLLVNLNVTASQVFLRGIKHTFNNFPEYVERNHLKLLIPLLISAGEYNEAQEIIEKFKFSNRMSREFSLIEAFHAQTKAASAIESVSSDWRIKFLEMIEIPFKYFDCLSPTVPHFSDLEKISEKYAEDSEKISGPKISVILTCYQPRDEIYTAVKSIIYQTWSNWELLIIDDGSGKDFKAVFSNISELDNRIRIIHLEENKGTYNARNIGFLEASGDYITGQDSDDWSHPDRLSQMIKPLLMDNSLLATLSHGVRATANLDIRTQFGQPVRCEVAVSLMIKKNEVVYRIGFYDEVRKAADSEYHLRLLHTFGNQAVAVLQQNLYVIRYEINSLSRSDFSPGWRHPHREYYKLAYTNWHKKILLGESPFLERGGKRKFYAPLSYSFKVPNNNSFSKIIVCDFKQKTTLLESAINTVKELSITGKKVALFHIDSLRHFSKDGSELAAEVITLLEEQKISIVSFDDEVFSDEVLVFDYEALIFTNRNQSNWKIKKVKFLTGSSTQNQTFHSNLVTEIVNDIWPGSEVDL